MATAWAKLLMHWNIDRGNLGKYFREYKNEEIKELHGELFDMQTARLMELMAERR